LTPTIGGHKGGTIITITGKGFPIKDVSRAHVSIGSVNAKVISVSNTVIKVETLPMGTGNTLNLTFNSLSVTNEEFTYRDDITPVITGLSI